MKTASRATKGGMLAVAVIVSLFQSSCGLLACPKGIEICNKLTLEQISDAVRVALPPGSTLAEIEKYLTNNNVEYSYVKEDNQVAAAIRNIRGGGFLMSRDALIVITLDKAGNLADINIRSVSVGM